MWKLAPLWYTMQCKVLQGMQYLHALPYNLIGAAQKASELKTCMYEFQGQTYATDAEGFLKDPLQWSEALAEHIASVEELTLSDEHWLIIRFVRDYFFKFNTTPAIRLLVTSLKREFGEEVGNSRYLQRMFKESPAKMVAKLAGLPKPAKCL